MNVVLAYSWWSLVIRGLLGIAVGVITFLVPGITFASLVLVFAAYALIDGIVSIVGTVRAAKAHERWGSLLIEGIAGITIAGITLLWPGITALALVLCAASWALVTGVLEIVAAVRLRKIIEGEWLLALSGLISIAFAILVFASPVAGSLAVALWFGAYAF